MKSLVLSLWVGAFFLTADQQGARLMARGNFKQAAETFESPMHQATAWYRAKQFKKAEPLFGQLQTVEAYFNRGNCLVFLGDYEEAILSYDRALALRPHWDAALINRQIAVAQAANLDFSGGDMGDQKIGVDEVKYDKKKEAEGGQETDVETPQTLSDQQFQSIWLRSIQSDPAQFLKTKFLYQQAGTENDAQ